MPAWREPRAHPLIDRSRARKTWRVDAGERGPRRRAAQLVRDAQTRGQHRVDIRPVLVGNLRSEILVVQSKPVIDRTFKFDDMVEVHRYLESSEQFGKIVVTL
jgi:hypothetical protein